MSNVEIHYIILLLFKILKFGILIIKCKIEIGINHHHISYKTLQIKKQN